jgi:Protein of unknown function (DUF2752)
MTPHNGSRIAIILRAAAPPAIALLAAATLLRLPPAQNDFYPRCPFHELFNLKCPGCGATRAVAALLHGDLIAALHWNALATLLLPLAAIYSVDCYRQLLRNKPLRWQQPPPSAIYAALAAAVVFAMIRNLPNASF